MLSMKKLIQIFSYKKASLFWMIWTKQAIQTNLSKLCNLFSAGSRIIITTKDADLPDHIKVDISEVDIYMVKKLGPIDS